MPRKVPKDRKVNHWIFQRSILLFIIVINLILLWDHPEVCNKIQDKYKETEFVMVNKHVEPNVCDIKPVNGKGPVHTLN